MEETEYNAIDGRVIKIVKDLNDRRKSMAPVVDIRLLET